MGEFRRVHARPDAEEGVETHDDLLQARVAGALPDPVHRDVNLVGSRLDGREAVRRREAEVVVAVDRDGHSGHVLQ